MKITDGLFLECFQEVAKGYPEIKSDDIIVDDLCMKLVTRPDLFDKLNTMEKVFTYTRSCLQDEQVLELAKIKYDKDLGYPLKIYFQNFNLLINAEPAIITISDFQIMQ